jgi:hypothetical protein
MQKKNENKKITNEFPQVARHICKVIIKEMPVISKI